MAEYTSAAIAQHVCLWLIQIGAPPDLIRDGLRVVADELAHSELSAAVAETAGGVTAAAVIDPATLALPGEDPATALVSVIVRFFCIGETVAVPLFRMLRQRCSVAVARRALDRVMRDEARHRQFGWDVLDWVLLTGRQTDVSELIASHIPGMLSDVLTAYAAGGGGELSVELLNAEVIAWGLAPPCDYARTVSSAIDSDVVPRLAARGLAPMR